MADFFLSDNTVLSIDAAGAAVRLKAADLRFVNPDNVVDFGNVDKTFEIIYVGSLERTFAMKTKGDAKGAAREFARAMSSAKQSCGIGGTIPDPAGA